jgi:biopolymer transport protein ExbB
LELWRNAVKIWLDGGPAMAAIAVIALVMFWVGMQISIRMGATGFQKVSESVWRRWITHPAQRRGRIGDLVEYAMGRSRRDVKQIAEAFDEIHTTESQPFERDLRVMKVCVSAAPLVGLLGTVTGMLATFRAVGSGAGGDQTMDMVAGGISEALITTETGLVVGLPGLFFLHFLARRFDRYKAFLAHLESVCTQVAYKEQRVEAKACAKVIAAEQVKALLRDRIQPGDEPEISPTNPA